MQWELLGTVGLREAKWVSTIMPGTCPATLFSSIFPSPHLPQSSPCFSVRGRCGGCLSDSLLEEVCPLCHLSVTSPRPGHLGFPLQLPQNSQSKARGALDLLGRVLPVWRLPLWFPCLSVAGKCSQWLVPTKAHSLTDQSPAPPYFRLSPRPPILTRDVKVLFTFLGFPESLFLKYWEPLIEEINVNYAQTSGIEKKI